MFDEITERNPFVWTSMIHGYVEILSIRKPFLSSGICVSEIIISSILKAFGRLKWSRDGEAVFGFIWKCGFGFDLIVLNSVIDCFMRCGEVDCARRVCDEIMDEKNVVSWTSVICGYVRKGGMVEARSLLEAMPSKDMAAWNVMISGYTDVGDVRTAKFLFQAMPICDTGTWNLMISGYCKVGELEKSKDYFEQMPRWNVVLWTMMMDGNVKSGKVHEARCLFNEMSEKNLITWSTVISGYAKNGKPSAALESFKNFRKQSLELDETFMLRVISACSQLPIVDLSQ
ncbi:hypothetical protein BC332_15467 [Capsicum chinense]|nr:hypothetical protein BC332_15467 [Capsicum chinense]